MNYITRVLTTGSLAILMATAAFAQKIRSNKADDTAIITRCRLEWQADLHQKKLTQNVGLYADDGVFFSPDGTNAVGKAQITRLFAQVMQRFDSDITLESTGVALSANLAYDSGNYRETLVDRATQKPLHLAGSYLMVYKRLPNGNWKIVRHMWTNKA